MYNPEEEVASDTKAAALTNPVCTWSLLAIYHGGGWDM